MTTRPSAVPDTFKADALVVSSQSVLKRRRERAAYAMNELRLANRTRKALVLLAVGCVVIVLLGQIPPVRTTPVQDRPLPLSNLSRANKLDRFAVDYLV